MARGTHSGRSSFEMLRGVSRSARLSDPRLISLWWVGVMACWGARAVGVVSIRAHAEPEEVIFQEGRSKPVKTLNEIPEAWRLAMQREKESEEFYARMAQSSTDQAIRSLFETLVEQERQHYSILESEYRRIFEPDLELAKERLPITWYEWGEDSFDLAEALDLPVLLYITAPWCEPCHLMEQTTLAEPDVVTTINDDFLPILIDADKRPDVDSRYHQGGWPTTAFLNASGEVVESHNYLTAEQMLAVLQRIKARFAGEELPPAPIIAARPGIAVSELEEPPEAIGELAPELPEKIAGVVAQGFDRDHGGFSGAPKFHHADVLEFALAVAHRTGNETLLEVVHKSLESMLQGGLHDAVSGGFFRYATRTDWSVPHYEKMAGDQAQLMSLYLRAYQAFGRQIYLDTAQSILKYVGDVLWDRERGAFYSSQEADPDYYLLDAQARAEREAPYVDKTIHSARNAAVASAYLLASAVLDEPRYADLAIRALEFVWQRSYQEGLGMFHYFDNQAHLPGLLADQVSVAQAWLDAYEHFGREVYLQRAETLMRFSDNALRDADGRYFDTVAAPEAVGRLRNREKPFCENVIAAEVHLRLHRLTGREKHRQLARETLEALVPQHANLGIEAARFALVVDRLLRRPLLVTVVGENEDPLRAELLRAARRAYAANKTVQAVDPVWESSRLARLGYPAEPAPAAYICLGTLCARPTADPDEILAQAQAMLGQERKGVGAGWQYKGYAVDEGFKPEPRERFQYFLRVLKGDVRVFRYCVWTSSEAVAARWPHLDLDTEAGRAELEEHLRVEGRSRVRAKIDAAAFENWLLDLRGDGEEEVVLEERDD